MTSGLTPDPRRDFARAPRTGRTLTPRGVLAAVSVLILAVACAVAFRDASPF